MCIRQLQKTSYTHTCLHRAFFALLSGCLLSEVSKTFLFFL